MKYDYLTDQSVPIRRRAMRFMNEQLAHKVMFTSDLNEVLKTLPSIPSFSVTEKQSKEIVCHLDGILDKANWIWVDYTYYFTTEADMIQARLALSEYLV